MVEKESEMSTANCSQELFVYSSKKPFEGQEVDLATLKRKFRASEKEKELSPWLSEVTVEIEDRLWFLHAELIDFINYLHDFKGAADRRSREVKKLSKHIEESVPGLIFTICGSTASGLAVPSSDVDVLVQDSQNIYYGKLWKTLTDCLKNPSKSEPEQGVQYEVKEIKEAQVPIIKVRSRESGQKFDLVFYSDIAGSTKVAIELIRKMPEVKPLTIFIKVFLKARNLNQVITAGISSYGMMLMVASHCQ